MRLLVLSVTLRSSIADWLDAPERVKYKLVSMVHNCLHQKAPQYMMTAAFPSPMWPVNDIFVLPVIITWLCHDTISARMVVGHLLLLAGCLQLTE